MARLAVTGSDRFDGDLLSWLEARGDERVEIRVWQEKHESPFNFEFALEDKTIRGETRTKALATAARHVRARVDQELRERRHKARL
jgi:hypothetical protein